MQVAHDPPVQDRLREPALTIERWGLGNGSSPSTDTPHVVLELRDHMSNNHLDEICISRLTHD